MPVYRPLIPTGTVKLDVDYQNVQDNFNQANVVYGTDHYPLDNATAGQIGFHKRITLPAGAAPVTTAGQGKVYTQDSAVQPGRTDLYYAYQTDAGVPYTGELFPLNFCKAFGRSSDPGGLDAGTEFNVTSANLVGNTWTIILTSAASDNVSKMMVFVNALSASTINQPNIIIDSATQIRVVRQNSSATSISFMVVAI